MTRSLVISLALMLIAGCGPKIVRSVSGQVRFNGQPLPGAHVKFWPKDDPQLGACGAFTDRDGRFHIALGPNTGMHLKPGRFTVMVEAGPANAPEDPDLAALRAVGMFRPAESLPASYNDESRSPLEVEVALDGPNEFVLDLQGR